MSFALVHNSRPGSWPRSTAFFAVVAIIHRIAMNLPLSFSNRFLRSSSCSRSFPRHGSSIGAAVFSSLFRCARLAASLAPTKRQPSSSTFLRTAPPAPDCSRSGRSGRQFVPPACLIAAFSLDEVSLHWAPWAGKGLELADELLDVEDPARRPAHLCSTLRTKWPALAELQPPIWSTNQQQPIRSFYSSNFHFNSHLSLSWPRAPLQESRLNFIVARRRPS